MRPGGAGAEHGKTPHADVLADLRDQVAPALVHALPGGERRSREGSEVPGPAGERALGYGLSERAEILRAGDEVGLAVHLDQRSGMSVAGAVDGDHAFG